MQNLKYVGATVIEFRFFNRIMKKKKVNNLGNFFYKYYTHTTSNYIIKYGSIGKHPVQSPLNKVHTTVLCDSYYMVVHTVRVLQHEGRGPEAQYSTRCSRVLYCSLWTPIGVL